MKTLDSIVRGLLLAGAIGATAATGTAQVATPTNRNMTTGAGQCKVAHADTKTMNRVFYYAEGGVGNIESDEPIQLECPVWRKGSNQAVSVYVDGVVYTPNSGAGLCVVRAYNPRGQTYVSSAIQSLSAMPSTFDLHFGFAAGTVPADAYLVARCALPKGTRLNVFYVDE